MLYWLNEMNKWVCMSTFLYTLIISTPIKFIIFVPLYRAAFFLLLVGFILFFSSFTFILALSNNGKELETLGLVLEDFLILILKFLFIFERFWSVLKDFDQFWLLLISFEILRLFLNRFYKLSTKKISNFPQNHPNKASFQGKIQSRSVNQQQSHC